MVDFGSGRCCLFLLLLFVNSGQPILVGPSSTSSSSSSSASFSAGSIRGTTICELPECDCSQSSVRIICTCLGNNTNEEIVLRGLGEFRIPENAYEVTVTACPKVNVLDSAFANVRNLRSVKIEHIGILKIQSRGFAWPGPDAPANHFSSGIHSPPALILDPADIPDGLLISLVNVTIPELPQLTFRGRIDVISFQDVRVGRLGSFAFASLQATRQIIFLRCNITLVEGQAFKKFTIRESFHLEKSNFFNGLPSRAIVDIDLMGTGELRIDGVNVAGPIRSSAVIMQFPRLVIMQNNIWNRIEGDAFRISSTSKVILKDESYESLGGGALRGLQPLNPSQGQATAVIVNTTLGEFSNGSLALGEGWKMKIETISIGKSCQCALLNIWRKELAPLLDKNEAFKQIRCRQTTKGPNGFKWITLEEFNNSQCHHRSTAGPAFLIGIVIGGLGVIGLIAVLVWFCHRRRRRRWLNVPTQDKPTPLATTTPAAIVRPTANRRDPASLRMVVPDGRTYRETELHVIVERAEPLNQPNSNANKSFNMSKDGLLSTAIR